MIRFRFRFRPWRAPIVILVAVAAVMAAAASSGRQVFASAVLVCLLTIVVGEVAGVSVRGQRLAPVSSVALGSLALAPLLGGPRPLSWITALLVGVVGLCVGQALRHGLGWSMDALSVLMRAAGLVVALLLARTPLFSGRSVLDLTADPGTPTWLHFVLLLTVAALATLSETVSYWSIRRRSLGTVLVSLARGQLGEMTGLLAAVILVTTFVALGAPLLGGWSLILFEWPIWLALFGIRRYAMVNQAIRQTDETLAQVTDLTGHTRAGHSRAVADTAVLVGRRLGLNAAELRTLERAALLHDLGQVVLPVPIPGGATVDAAPADQQAIADAGAHIVRRAGGFDDIAHLLDQQTAPYRLVRERDIDIPLSARIIKVVNAYVDLTEGAHSVRAHEAAMERISLGLGYEYDPAVVEALAQATEPSPTTS